MHKQERAIRLRQGYGGLKAGLKSRQLKVTPPPRSPALHYHRIYKNAGMTPAAD